MNPDGSEFTLLHTYDACGSSTPFMRYADGYLYSLSADVQRLSIINRETGEKLVTKSSHRYMGTRDMPTGRVGESAPTDFIASPTTKICRFDVNDHSVTGYTPGTSLDPDDGLTIMGESDGKLLAALLNKRKHFENDESYASSVCLTLSEEGTFDIERVFEQN